MSDCYVTPDDYRRYWKERADLLLIKGHKRAIDKLRLAHPPEPCPHCGERCFLDVPCLAARRDEAV